MSRPLLYDLWPTVIERMDLANRILLTQKYPELRRTDQRCRADANTVEITATSLKINNTSFQVEKYESGEHAEVFKDTVNSKRVVLKTTVLLYEARMRLFKAIMKRRSGILNVKNLSILVDVNSPPNLKLCVQNVNVARPYCDLAESFREKEKRTIRLIVNLQKALTADSFPLESLEIDNNFSLVSSGVAKTVITTRSLYGIQNSNVHRVQIKNCTMISTRVADLIRNWQVSEPEVGRHYSMETGCFDSVVRYFSVAEQFPGAQINATLASGMFQFGLTFPINQEKVLNVFMDNSKDEGGMDNYVIHFKIDPNL